MKSNFWSFLWILWRTCYFAWQWCKVLREKCPNTEFFLVRIFPHSDWIRRDTVFSPNVGKYGPQKTPYFDTFHAVGASWFLMVGQGKTLEVSIFILLMFVEIWSIKFFPLRIDFFIVRARSVDNPNQVGWSFILPCPSVHKCSNVSSTSFLTLQLTQSFKYTLIPPTLFSSLFLQENLQTGRLTKNINSFHSLTTLGFCFVNHKLKFFEQW